MWLIWDKTASALAGSNPYPSREDAEAHLDGRPVGKPGIAVEGHAYAIVEVK